MYLLYSREHICKRKTTNCTRKAQGSHPAPASVFLNIFEPKVETRSPGLIKSWGRKCCAFCVWWTENSKKLQTITRKSSTSGGSTPWKDVPISNFQYSNPSSCECIVTLVRANSPNTKPNKSKGKAAPRTLLDESLR